MWTDFAWLAFLTGIAYLVRYAALYLIAGLVMVVYSFTYFDNNSAIAWGLLLFGVFTVAMFKWGKH